MNARLTYFSGSPFARMARVLVSEWELPIAPEEHAFPPSRRMFELNPLGQVPALILPDRTVFPTFLILEALWQMAGSPPSAYVPPADRQILLTVLQAGDALAAAWYQKWAGLEPTGRNQIGYDPAQRHIERVYSVLHWVADGRIRPGVTLPGIAIACLMLWADASEGLDWRIGDLGQLVDDLASRPSLLATQPQAWRAS